MFIKSLLYTVLTIIGAQKPWSHVDDNRTEVSGPVVAYEMYQSLSQRSVCNSTELVEHNGSKLNISKDYKNSEQINQYPWNIFPPYKREVELDIPFKTEINKEKDSKNSSRLPFPDRNNISSSNVILKEDKGILFHDQQSSLQIKPENNTDVNGEYDELNDFDWRRREDSYNKTDPRDFPYAVMLIMSSQFKEVGACSGSLITDEWVLTAAHCCYKFDAVKVYAGGNSKQELDKYKENPRRYPLPETAQLRTASKIIASPCYENKVADCDVGLVKVEEKFRMTDSVNVVRLTRTPWKATYHSYAVCTLTGFGNVRIRGRNEDDMHRKTSQLEVKQPCLCNFRLQILVGTKVAGRYICTKPKQDYGACPGDSGGGLVCGGLLRAVTSQLIALDNTETCAVAPIPIMECGATNTLSVFQDICPFLPWINQHVQLFNASQISKQCVYTGKSHLVHSSVPLLLFANVVIVVIKVGVL